MRRIIIYNIYLLKMNYFILFNNKQSLNILKKLSDMFVVNFFKKYCL